jgi:hypothetical protein
MSNFSRAMSDADIAISEIKSRNLHPFDEQNEIRKLQGMEELTLAQWILSERNYKTDLDVVEGVDND